MRNVNINHLKSLQNEVLRGLAFYQEELKILQNRLEEIVIDNNKNVVMENVGHFENQLLIQRNNIDELKHDVNAHLQHLKSQLVHSPDFVSEGSAAENDDLYERYLIEEKTINDLRKEFNRFATKWM